MNKKGDSEGKGNKIIVEVIVGGFRCHTWENRCPSTRSARARESEHAKKRENPGIKKILFSEHKEKFTTNDR